MNRWLALGLLVVVVAVAGAILVLAGREPADRPDPRGPPAVVGFADNAVSQRLVAPRADARLLAAAGAQVVRVQLDWRAIEPRRGFYRLAEFDALYRAYRAQGIGLLLIFAYAPPWAAARSCPVPCLTAPAESRVPDAARTAAMLARRYPKLAGIEIWNEPNTPYFWGGPPDAVAYTRLLRASHRAIKRARPSMPVVGGAVANATSTGSVPLAQFLTEILDQGAARYMDAVSIHPYPDPGDVSGESADRAVDQAQDALAAGGAGSLPIWLTELGLSTTGPDAVSDPDQAKALVALVKRFRTERGIRAVYLHTLIEPAKGPEDRETGFGVVRADLRPKPAFCALARTLGSRTGCTGRDTIAR